METIETEDFSQKDLTVKPTFCLYEGKLYNTKKEIVDMLTEKNILIDNTIEVLELYSKEEIIKAFPTKEEAETQSNIFASSINKPTPVREIFFNSARWFNNTIKKNLGIPPKEVYTTQLDSDNK